MASILYCTIYILFFSYLILAKPFFRLPQCKGAYTLWVFYLKLLFGVALWYIYAYHYHNRLTSDIFKYYDDSKIIYSAWHKHFGDFIQMLTGFGRGDAHLKSYYLQMNSWDNNYGSTLYNNSHFITRLNALLLFFSDGHYGVHVIFMCFFSLAGLILIYKSFSTTLTAEPKMLFAAVFLFPSVLLWSSGVLKESLVLLGLGLSIYYFRRCINENTSRVKNLCIALLGMALLFENKAYILVCLLPCLIAWYAAERFDYAKKHPLLIYFTVTLLYLFAGLNLGRIKAKYNPIEMLATKQQEFNRITHGGLYLIAKSDSTLFACLPGQDTAMLHPTSNYADSLLQHKGVQYLSSAAFYHKEKTIHHTAYFTIKKGLPYILIKLPNHDTLRAAGNDSTLYEVYSYNLPAKSFINIKPINASWGGLIKGVPQALSVSLLHPFPAEIHSSAEFIYFLENDFIILLILLALVFSKKWKDLPKNEIAFCFTYCLLMLTLIGFVTPVYGGIERYKCLVMPFLLILLLLIYDSKKLKRLFNRKANAKKNV